MQLIITQQCERHNECERHNDEESNHPAAPTKRHPNMTILIHRHGSLYLLFLVLTCASTARGFAIPSGRSSFNPLRMSTKVNAAPTPREDTVKAVEALERCAKFSALSAVVDIGTVGSDFVNGDWLAALRTIWKVTFAVNLWQVGRIQRGFVLGQDLQKKNEEQDALQLLKVLDRMTRVWRVAATMTFLTTTTGVLKAWGTHIPLLQEGLIALVLTVIAGVFYYSSQETKDLTNVDIDTAREDPFLPRIEKKGAVLVRVMGMACAALFLKVGLLPIIALSTAPHAWQKSVLTLLDIPTPLALATCLLSFRRSYVNILLDVSSQPQANKKTDDLPWQPESQQQLAQEAHKFYSKIFTTLRGEIISKTLFAIRSFFW
eukprot:scaffold38286_cov52-Attheya_sp.AAC.1